LRGRSFGHVAIADIAQEIRLDLAAREEGGIDLGVVEARHRAAIEARARAARMK